jgi:PIN domain nuclease of toxin-antitoxin system
MVERLLLDTHTIIWSALDVDKLSSAARSAIENPDNNVYFSPVTTMEIATKVRIGKLDMARPLATGFADQMIGRGFIELPLVATHAEMAGSFLSGNNDPWDRLLAAQARIEQMGLVTNDSKMDDFGVRIFW